MAAAVRRLPLRDGPFVIPLTMKTIRLTTISAAFILGLSFVLGWLAPGSAKPGSSGQSDPNFPKEIGHPPFMSPHASPIALHGDRVFVVNTPSDTVDVIDAKTRKIVARIDVGIDPVSVAVRPDGKEVWVANHISDSVSVIDNDPESPTCFHVIATIQEFDPRTKATRFDEPVGIAFAGNEKAYVALSSENQIAVIDVPTRKITKRLSITAQDPRAIAVRDGRLYVIAFESNNQTQLSGGRKEEIDGDLVTFDIYEHSIRHNNILSLGHVTDIVKHPEVPDRDLYVFDTTTDKLIKTVDTLGTLLYGLAVDSAGRVFIAQTDARNDANGRAGTKKHGLAELENRAFLNQITRVKVEGDHSSKPEFFDLEPLLPSHPEPGKALATPFAIQISDDDSTLVVSAAGSDKVFTVDARSGKVLGRVDVDAVPRGIVLKSDADGKASQAWVLNAVANTVSLVDLSNPSALKTETTIALEDPSHPAFKRGRIAFNTAKASTTKSFSCASCHPDGHTDQLLWVLKTPIVTGGNQIMPRSTMPIRGLRDTAPFHWDGIPGDPYGGSNSANIRSHVDPNSDIGQPESTSRHLIDGGLASTMMRVGDETKNDEGKAGELTATERDDMAKFLLNVTYPPAQKRAYTNELSDRAEKGFELFHIIGNEEGKPQRNVCGNCHRMPFLVSTNTPGSGMDAPTWRGAYDRFLILPQGRLNVIDLDFYQRVAERGIPERDLWRFSWRSKPEFDPVWNMVLEGSTGFSGSLGRQVTLNETTANDELIGDLLDALESSAREGGIVLQSEGLFLKKDGSKPVTLQFDGAAYAAIEGSNERFPREQLISLASKGAFIGTFTGRHGENADYDHPQPALWTLGPIHAQRGKQEFPVLFGEDRTMIISGRHLREGVGAIVDGRKVDAVISIGEDDRVEIALGTLPAPGIHFLQVQNPDGLFSNDFIFHVAASEAAAKELSSAAKPNRHRRALGTAISEGNIAEAKRLIRDGASLNARHDDNGSIPLVDAAFHGELEIATALLNRGARVSHTNRDGTTALHTAAFFCRTELVELLLDRGASTEKKNERGETPIDVVAGEWDEGLAGIYRFFDGVGSLDLDMEKIRRTRPEIAKQLRDHAAEAK